MSSSKYPAARSDGTHGSFEYPSERTDGAKSCKYLPSERSETRSEPLKAPFRALGLGVRQLKPPLDARSNEV
jgi:hypothetical protein